MDGWPFLFLFCGKKDATIVDNTGFMYSTNVDDDTILFVLYVALLYMLTQIAPTSHMLDPTVWSVAHSKRV